MAKKQTSLKIVQANPSPAPAAGSPDIDAAKRREREEAIAKISVSDAVEMIIYEVDQRFPSALPIDSKLEPESLTERCYDIEELFRTAEMRDDEERIFSVICSVEETEATRALDSAVMDLKSSLEPFYLAIGFAAGLRAAAIPRATVGVMMLGLLRNFGRQS
jgi:hypothetical protein